jgi:hypothetical protein
VGHKLHWSTKHRVHLSVFRTSVTSIEPALSKLVAEREEAKRLHTNTHDKLTSLQAEFKVTVECVSCLIELTKLNTSLSELTYKSHNSDVLTC